MEYKLPFYEYNEALKKNQLMGLRCIDCGKFTCPPMMVCQDCSSVNVEVCRLSGKGKITTFTTSFLAPEGREDEVPYTIVLVELDEGPWIMGNLDIEADHANMDLIGKRVALNNKLFEGDKYSAGDAARPLFIIE